jgi:hypothetical protein
MGANSYAANALPFLTAMKQADPMAKIGVPWAFEPTEASGAGVVTEGAAEVATRGGQASERRRACRWGMHGL